jgi:lipoprotein-releasing system permease protein
MTTPFAPFEWMIAWRYLRARRAEGGVSTMTWISLIGITLAVFALIVVMSVRAGFRTELVDTIVGANAHVTVYAFDSQDAEGRPLRGFAEGDPAVAALAAIPGVTRAAPLVRGQVLANFGTASAPGDVYGIRPEDLATIPRIGAGSGAVGDLARFPEGVAIGSVLADQLGVGLGDRIRLISPNGARTPMGTSPRVMVYEVTWIFTAGRPDMDRIRIYLPLAEAQAFFNRDGRFDEIEVMVADPDRVEDWLPAIEAAVPASYHWTWMQSAGGYLRALTMEDRVMLIIMSILVLIASLNITSGLIMLVKNKGRDIGILRTMGLTEGSILRVFFLCGAFTGVVGTTLGVILGCLFAIYIDPIFAAVNWLVGGGAWDPTIRQIYFLPAELRMGNIAGAVGLSLGLAFLVTIIPARRAARLNPVEALRYE